MVGSRLDDMSLTVAVCTYNPKPELMVRVMDAIAGQRGTGGDVEVLVIDNNSNPPVASAIELDRYETQVIVEPTQGLTAARATAIRAARGDVIIFVDDDNVLGDRYLKTVADAFTRYPRLGLLGGSVYPSTSANHPRGSASSSRSWRYAATRRPTA